jgi:aryl-alcohol dehydrogenase-like predicted oxidoreductase
VYLQGLLSSPEARWPAGHDPALFTAALDGLVRELGRDSAADLCVAYVLAHPWVTSIVVGAETPAQVRETARIAGRPALKAEEVLRVQGIIPEGPTDLIDPALWRTP